MSRTAIFSTLLCVIVSLYFFVGTTWAQSNTFFNQRDDQYRLLGLKRAKEAYDVAKAEFDRQDTLFERGLLSESQLEQARVAMSDAEVNFQQSLLAVLFERQYVTVLSAVKYYAADGTRHVRLRLANASRGGAEFQKLIHIDDELFRSLQPDVVNDVYVSLLNDDNAIISLPYETKITQLVFDNPVELDFRVLQDLDAVTVSIIYGSGTQRMMKIFLQKDVSQNKVALQSEQFSQEVDLGKTATYDLGLELFSGTSNTFSLEVLDLPTQISRTFRDPSGGARLSQVKFSETTRSKRASLEVTLPNRPGEQVVVDKPIQFFVVAASADNAALLRKDNAKVWTAEELDKLDIGYVKLELIPRGSGVLLVRSNQWFRTIKADEAAEVSISLMNEGSDRIDNIEFGFDLPLNWSKQVEPTTVSALDISRDTTIHLTFTPPPQVAAGRYDIRVRSSGQSNGRPVNGEDKTVTVEIKPTGSTVGTILIVVLVLALVGGIVVFGIRISRR